MHSRFDTPPPTLQTAQAATASELDRPPHFEVENSLQVLILNYCQRLEATQLKASSTERR